MRSILLLISVLDSLPVGPPDFFRRSAIIPMSIPSIRIHIDNVRWVVSLHSYVHVVFKQVCFTVYILTTDLNSSV